MSSFSGRWAKRVVRFLRRPGRDLKVIGHLDGVRDGTAYGWAWRPARPGERLLVDVFVNGRLAGQRLADMPRPDLLSQGIGDGRYAFELTFDPSMRPRGDDAVRAYAVCDPRVELHALFESGESVGIESAEDYLRATFSKVLSSEDHNAEVDEGSNPVEPADRRRFDRLFATSPVEGPPLVLGKALCAYLDQNRFKWDLAREFDTTISREDYGAFLKQYVEMYGRARRPLRVPLSADDLAFLNAGPTSVSAYSASRAQKLLSEAIAPDDASESTKFERIYRWAVYDSVILCVEDCLVAKPHEKLLATCEEDEADRAYPLSRFMKRFLQDNVFLSRIDTNDEDGRMLAYFAVLLFSMTSPHYLSYAPAVWRDELLSATKGTSPQFDRLSSRVFGDCRLNVQAWRARISRLGFDCSKNEFRYRTNEGHRLHSPATPISRAKSVDVQIIGPFSKQLGIANSCRSLVDALRKLDYSIRLCDFAIDYPNRIRTDDAYTFAEPGLASINILHFNLEELPSAIAYMPDVFTGSHMIGFPYLELPRPHAAQLLGLSLLDEIWSASEFMTRALETYVPTHTVGSACRPLRRIGRGAARRIAYGEIVSDTDFVFLMSCDALSGAHRKNPLGVIRAFLSAFPDKSAAKLVVKVHSVDRVVSPHESEIWRRVRYVAAQCDNITLIDRVLDDDEQMALIEGADCLVSLHRAEGFGYHMLEAMFLGTLVIATAYSGNADFCSEETAILVPYRTIHIEHGQYPRTSAEQTWADPDFALSVEMMRKVRREAALRERVTDAARKFCDSHYSVDAFARRLDLRLASLFGAGGASRLCVEPAEGERSGRGVTRPSTHA
ncbi:hypothetical+protein [Methylocapsa aurea]|uniref:glycosyltransferase n=1 Tax=Methylocapsa aurea TaxID=663610 RepID=UPI003D18948D